MYAFALKYLLGLTFVGIIWTVRGETSRHSSASSDNKAARTRQRREETPSNTMTKEERIVFLTTHNQIRSNMTAALNYAQPPASNMMRMYWSAYLEAAAVSWAMRSCPPNFKFDQSEVVKMTGFISFLSKYGETVGQNIYIGAKPKPSSVVMSYASETRNFTYSSSNGGTCKAGQTCGQYTQIVWHDSFIVGCGYADCGGNYTSTCYYMRPGNWPGKPPYASGPPCSGCASNERGFTECKEQLCVPEKLCFPVEECEVVDRDHCLCSPYVYEEFVNRMIKTVEIGEASHGSPVVVFGLFLPLVAIALGQGVQLVFHSGLM